MLLVLNRTLILALLRRVTTSENFTIICTSPFGLLLASYTPTNASEGFAYTRATVGGVTSTFTAAPEDKFVPVNVPKYGSSMGFNALSVQVELVKLVMAKSSVSLSLSLSTV